VCNAVRVDTRLTAAVLDNARWCHLVCATLGIAGRFDEDAWVSARRTPPMYPDAVTLTEDVSIEALLSRIDRTAGCSIKDSFSTLDLTAAGFSVLFDADWFWRPAASPPPPAVGTLGWERVERRGDLRAWAVEHGAGSTFTPALFDEPGVTILAGRDRDGALIAGAVATHGDEAIGISNVFIVDVASGGDGSSTTFADAFAGATGAIVNRFPDRPIVGYLSAEDLAAARAAGFETIGPLRIWLLGGERSP
jgi:hypothetical protein